MPTIEITVHEYGPEESDENPSAYLARCGEALVASYGYDYSILVAHNGGEPVRQLQVTIPDDGSSGRKRAVMITAPEPVMDVGGEVMTQTAFIAKYGGA